MAERNKLASIPGQPLPERKGNFLSDLWDEASGAFARYGRRSGAQRDASLALMSQAADPNIDPFTGAGMKALGLAGLVTHPLAFFPTREEWDQRLQAAGNDSRIGRSIGGFLSDLPSLIDPQMAAGGAALAAAPIVGKLGRGIGDLAGDATDAELAALRARLQAEAAQTGGAANTTSRDEALQNLVGEQQRKQLVTQSYKETLPDGTERWVPGTLRSNPTTAPRFEPSMSLADIRRYIETFGEPPPPRAKGEIVTGKRKDVYPDGTVTPVPGLLRTKRPDSNTGRMGQAIGGMLGDLPSIVDPHLLAGGGALAAAPLVAKMAKPAAAVRVLPTDVTGYSRGESFGTKLLKVDDAPQAAADLSILGDTVYINNIETLEGSRRSGLASKLLDDIFAEFPDKKIAVTNMTDDGSNFFRKKYTIDEDGVLSRKEN